MSTPTVYVVCDQNCRWESMTKEQILAAITQAVENHQIADVDTGFVTTIKTVNGIGLKFFIGTQAAWAEYPSDQKEGVFAIFTNDTTGDALKTAIEAVQQALANILDGTQAVPKATNAINAENAANAAKTDFSNAEWTHVAYNGRATIENGGVYQIRIKMYPTPLQYVEGIITAELNEQITIGTRLAEGNTTKYMDFEMAYATVGNGTMTVNIKKFTITFNSSEITTKDGNTLYGWDYRRIR